MTAEQIALAALVLNTLVVPCTLALARLLWRLERRIFRVELKLGIDSQEG